ncbi:hypothetical protein ACQKWADRAFT_315110 [Trichoderma austrokoningii]
MLYIRSELGMIFVNCPPAINQNNCAECMAMLFFSEWLADIVAIYVKNGYKVTILSTGKLPDDSVSDDIKSSYTMVKGLRTVDCENLTQAVQLSMCMSPRSNLTPDNFHQKIGSLPS